MPEKHGHVYLVGLGVVQIKLFYKRAMICLVLVKHFVILPFLCSNENSVNSEADQRLPLKGLFKKFSKLFSRVNRFLVYRSYVKKRSMLGMLSILLCVYYISNHRSSNGDFYSFIGKTIYKELHFTWDYIHWLIGFYWEVLINSWTVPLKA